MSRSYYIKTGNVDNNIKCTEDFLRVNCTGHSLYTGDIKVRSSRHDFYLIYLYGGAISVNEPIVQQDMRAGDLIIFSPETRFDYFNPDGVDLDYYWVHFTGNAADKTLSDCGLLVNQVMTPGHHERICENFRKLFNAFLARDKFLDLDTANKLHSLLVTTGKCVVGKFTDDVWDYSRIRGAVSFIHDNIDTAIKVEELASRENMSTSHFRAVFHKITGMSPMTYIMQTKLGFSCELLRQTKLSINEIAGKIGYIDPQYFTRVFTKHFGLSPTSYRTKNKE